MQSFSDTCSYCYNGLQNGLSVCTCDNSLCSTHCELHTSKFGCSVKYSLSLGSDNKVEVVCDSGEDTAIIQSLIESRIFKCGCKHIECSQKHSLDAKTAVCGECGLPENLWVCVVCGHLGCGRKQANSNGNGHALAHFQKTGHPVSVLLSSIVDGFGDVFCYVCEDFVYPQDNLNIVVMNSQETRKFDSQGSVPSDILGITNEGQNCYITAVLHLLCEVCESSDLDWHFQVCESNPLTCLCCQFIKIMNEMRSMRNTVKCVKISDFLRCVFNQMPGFQSNIQEDCSEFLFKMLESLKFFEECGMMAKITENLEFERKNSIKCEACAVSSEETTRGMIFTSSFEKSLNEVVAKHLRTREEFHKPDCKATFQGCFTKYPKFLVIHAQRNIFEEHRSVKIDEDIETGVIDAGSNKYEVIGCVCHKGDQAVSGHYTWIIRRGGKVFVANDAVISEGDERSFGQGTLFLTRILDKDLS